MSKWEYTESDLWHHNDGEASLYHVFGLIAEGSVVLAFAEGREGKGGDSGCLHSIFMRRSTDGGRNFSPSVCLCPAEGKRCWTNPVPVYDGVTGRLFLFISDNPDNLHTENFVLHSDDLGVSWSSGREIGHFLEQGAQQTTLHLAGPGHGIQIKGGSHDGRLIVPFWHRSHGPEKLPRERGYGISLLCSDDRGETWRQKTFMGQECMANESRIGQTREGLLWVIRPGAGNPCRYASISRDGGESFPTPVPQASGAANNCDAGLCCLFGKSGKSGYEDTVLISRVSRLNYRRDMEILISPDGGLTFPDSMQLPPGDAMPGYSDLCVIEEEEPVIGLVHCRENHVLFTRISMQALTGGKYHNTERKVWL